jgi:hypothetical protein
LRWWGQIPSSLTPREGPNRPIEFRSQALKKPKLFDGIF